VPRSEQLEAILEAQYELEVAEPQELASCLERLHARVEEVIVGTKLTRRELLSALADRYRDYKRARLLAEHRRRSL
jgi:hypothetical protein